MGRPLGMVVVSWPAVVVRVQLCAQHGHQPDRAVGGDTFDPATIDRELGWAREIGFNTLRINLHYFAWEADPAGLLERIDRFLDIAAGGGLSVMFCLFDDCSHNGKQPHQGRQDEPVPGVHNSGWTPSPGHALVGDRAAWPKLERYVAGVVGRFAADRRVLLWDLYNEPGNSGMGDGSLGLLRECFAWARAAGAGQPLSSGIWSGDVVNPPPGGCNETLVSLCRCGQLPQLRPTGRPGGRDRGAGPAWPADDLHGVDAPHCAAACSARTCRRCGGTRSDATSGAWSTVAARRSSRGVRRPGAPSRPCGTTTCSAATARRTWATRWN